MMAIFLKLQFKWMEYFKLKKVGVFIQRETLLFYNFGFKSDS